MEGIKLTASTIKVECKISSKKIREIFMQRDIQTKKIHIRCSIVNASNILTAVKITRMLLVKTHNFIHLDMRII